MSVSEKEISHVSGRDGASGGDGRNDLDDDEEDDDEAGSGINAGGKYELDGDRKKLRRNGYDGFGKNIRKVRQVVQLHFTKAKEKITSIKNNQKGSSASASGPSSSGTMSATLRSSGTRSKSCLHSTGQSSAGFQGCYFCFSQLNNLESPGGFQTSDPEGTNFTNAMLRSFIEKNDFRSKERNPHLK